VCVSWLGACNFVRLVTAIIVSIGYVGDRLHVGVVHGDSLNAEWTNLSTGGRCVNLSAQQGSLPSPLLAPLSFYTTVCLLSISSGRECWRPAVVSAQRDATRVYRLVATSSPHAASITTHSSTTGQMCSSFRDKLSLGYCSSSSTNTTSYAAHSLSWAWLARV